jgi:hypothetical protein
VRVESASRMEFRRQHEGIVVRNDDREVARIEGGFIAFKAGADMSVDEAAAIVEYARKETKLRECARALCEAVRRIMDAHGVTIPDDLIVSIARMGTVNPDLNVRLDMRHGCWPDDRTRVEVTP